MLTRRLYRDYKEIAVGVISETAIDGERERESLDFLW